VLAAAVALDASADEVSALEEAIHCLRRLAEADPCRLAAQLLDGWLQGAAGHQTRALLG
jgi:hypothetical protein